MGPHSIHCIHCKRGLRQAKSRFPLHFVRCTTLFSPSPSLTLTPIFTSTSTQLTIANTTPALPPNTASCIKKLTSSPTMRSPKPWLRLRRPRASVESRKQQEASPFPRSRKPRTAYQECRNGHKQRLAHRERRRGKKRIRRRIESPRLKKSCPLPNKPARFLFIKQAQSLSIEEMPPKTTFA